MGFPPDELLLVLHVPREGHDPEAPFTGEAGQLPSLFLGESLACEGPVGP